METLSSSSSSSSSEFEPDDFAAADTLLLLQTAVPESRHRPVTGGRSYPRWINKKKRSVPGDQNNAEAVGRLSPATPLSFSPSGGDDTPTPPPPSLPPPPLPPRPKIKSLKKMDDQYKALLKEQKQRIKSLCVTKLNLQQSVMEAERRYQNLKGANSWLKDCQSKWRQALWVQQQQSLERINGGSSSSRTLDLFPVGPTRSAVRLPDLNDEAAAAIERRRRQQQRARKRRLELQRIKSSSSSSPAANVQRLR